MGHVLHWILAYLLPRATVGAALRSHSPLERVTLAVLLGVVWVFAVHMLGLWAGLTFDARQIVAYAVPLAAAAWNAATRRLGPLRGEWPIVLLLLAAAAWMLACAITLPMLYGGGWMGDWLEHYQRTQYFLTGVRPPRISMTARPPLFNVVAASWAGTLGRSFADYQTIHAFLGVLALLGATLFYVHSTRDSRPRAIALCFVCLLLHPVLATNALYPWSRMLTTFCALAGVYFYMRAHLDREARLYAPAFLALGAAVASHFSSGTLAVVIGLHWLYSIARGRVPARAVAQVAAAGIATVGVWLLWSVRTFGWARTLSSHTTADNFAAVGLEGVARQWAYNLATTLIPFWDGQGLARWFRQESQAGALYDGLHLYWAGTLVGSVSTALAVTLLVGRIGGGLPKDFLGRAEVRFLLGLIAATFFASFLTIPNLEVAGISQLALQPVSLILFGLGLALVRESSAWVRRTFVIAYFLEGALFYALKTFDRAGLGPDQLSFGYAINAGLKAKHQLAFVADHAADVAGVVRVLVWLAIPALFVFAWRELGHSDQVAGPAGAT